MARDDQSGLTEPEDKRETLDEAIDRLAALDPLEYDQCRLAEAKALKIRVGTLDGAVVERRTAREECPKSTGLFDDEEPWPLPVDGAALARELVELVHHHLVTPDCAPEAMALWLLFAHAHDAFDHSPILLLFSPEKRCGKSTTCQLIARLAPKGLLIVSPTSAAMFRAIEKYQPTLIVDEGDQLRLADQHDLLAIFNSGHMRASATTLRCVGDDHDPTPFSTWAPKVFAGIGKPPDTLVDRSVVVSLRRKLTEEKTARIRGDRDKPPFRKLRRQAARWAIDHMDHLRRADDPEEPEGLSDRAADNWRPLFLIADALGGDWPRVARQASLALSDAIGAGDDEDTPGVILLRDIRSIFAARPTVSFLSSTDLVSALCGLEESPWSTWRHGAPVLPRTIKKLLAPFGVKPSRRNVGNGYHRADFEDAWARYLSSG